MWRSEQRIILVGPGKGQLARFIQPRLCTSFPTKEAEPEGSTGTYLSSPNKAPNHEPEQKPIILEVYRIEDEEARMKSYR